MKKKSVSSVQSEQSVIDICIMKQQMKILADGLRSAAANLRDGAYYAWGHHGACNCGHLLQVITQFSKEEILKYAHTGFGEWTELADESCPVTGAPITLLLQRLTDLGLTPTDIHNIEYLDNKDVLKRLPGGFRWLKKNRREDVIVYFETYAGWLEEKYQLPNAHHDKLMSEINSLWKQAVDDGQLRDVPQLTTY